MSKLTSKPTRLTVAPFSQLPAIGALPAITRPPASVAASVAGSAMSATAYVVARDERCLITRSFSYTHERARWISAVRGDEDRKTEVEQFIIGLGIVHSEFSLDNANNLANLDRVVHKSLDSYALIAVTGTLETLRELSSLIKADNDGRQQYIDRTGIKEPRGFKLFSSNPTFKNPKYQLVALHPEHFLPGGSVFTWYDPVRGTYKTYRPSPDRRLRESPGDLTMPSFAPFSGPTREELFHLNPLLVILNAEIKFRRYLLLPPPAQPLPEDVLDLITETGKLVDLIYWEVKATPGSAGERMRMKAEEGMRRNEPRPGRPKRETQAESSEDEFGHGSDGAGDATIRGSGRRGRGRTNPWPEDADTETRKEMGSAMLSGRNLEFDSEDEDFVMVLPA
ncbi:hypothetical protein BDN70DRAFT_870425 [Pholiota conissans]|uniref:Uncharacterized protein n=1 Tax=Pholiota conissans TaxID=109636 RepID=A0A9P6D056_9AGAR|nr:hypothetical protein BDN70DRAFT_870425 [Pholiota conissans]